MLSYFSHVWLCNYVNCSTSGSSVRGILQERILEWVAISSPGDLPNPGIEPVSFLSHALTGRFFTTSSTCGMFKSCENTHYLDVFFQSPFLGWEFLFFGKWLYNLSVMFAWELLYVLVSGARSGTWLKLSSSLWLLMLSLNSMSFSWLQSAKFSATWRKLFCALWEQ